MLNALITGADTNQTDDHRRARTGTVDHRRAAATTNASHRQRTPVAPASRRGVAFPADPWLAAESGPETAPTWRLDRLRLGSADEWLRWIRTYALLWLAGVILYLLLAVGAFIADGFLTVSP